MGYFEDLKTSLEEVIAYQNGDDGHVRVSTREIPDPDLQRAVATALIDARTKSGLTQEQLAEKSGISLEEVQGIERGEANPTLDTLRRLATGMDMRLRLEFVPIVEEAGASLVSS